MAREWLKKLRVDKKYTQASLARATGITVSRYSRIEAGYSELRDEEAKALAETLIQTIEFVRNGVGGSKPDSPKTVKSKEPTDATTTATPPNSAPAAPSIAAKGLSASHPILPSPTPKKEDDLSDPANFSLMPPIDALKNGALAPAEFRNRLQQHLAFSAKVLHTSKVKPRIWVAWRDFNKEAQSLLRGAETSSTVAAATELPATASPKSPVIAANPLTGKTEGRRKRGNKNLFGYFVEVAKEYLSAEKFTSLSTLATSAKEQRPELGFMKHFKLVAETELPPAEFDKISAEAERRHSA